MPESPQARELTVLRGDCANCAGLCCVAPFFSASADFAIDKSAGRPCPNLEADFRCGIHSRLAESGFRGCTVFDCFGAGQRVTQVIFGGRDWRSDPDVARPMFSAFLKTRQLHELLWYLTQALALPLSAPLPSSAPLPASPLPASAALRDDLLRARDDIERRTRDAGALAGTSVLALRERVNPLLLRASDLARAGSPGPRLNYRGADLRRTDLRGASLRGACLIGADLRAADLTAADVTGADLRDTDLRGADLAGILFLTQPQLDAARGDPATRLPPPFTRPAPWSAPTPAT